MLSTGRLLLLSKLSLTMTQYFTPKSKNSDRIVASFRAMTPRLNSSADFKQQTKNEIMKLQTQTRASE